MSPTTKTAGAPDNGLITGAALAYVLLSLTSLFWAGNAIAGKLAVGHISPMVLTAIRWGLALAFLVAIGGRQFWAQRREVVAELPLLFALGAAGFAVFNVALYSALKYTSAINVAIEQAAIPMLIFIINFALYRTRVTPAQMVGFVMSLVGVAVVASGGSIERLLALQLNRGDVLMGIAGIAYAAYSVALRYKPKLHWQTMMLAMVFAAFITSLPFAGYEIASGEAILPDMRGWLVAIYTATLPSIAAQVFYMKGVDLIGPNRAGLFINLIPVLGTGLAVVVLGEAFGLHHALAMALVIGGIALAERGKG